MKTTTIPAQSCACGLVLEATTDYVNDHAPEAGAISICGGCAALAVFQPDLTLRPMTAQEHAALADSVALEVARQQLAVRQVHASRRGAR